ncbi:MAG: lytic transglycosylase [Solirubrobacteraceae bacterium]
MAGVLLLAPSAAFAYFVHVVSPGETLSSIAAADGLSVDQLAAANGLSPSAQLIAGSTIQIPPQSGAAAGVAPALTSTSTGSTGSVGDGDSDADDVGGSASAASTSSSVDSYVVQPGDTLTGIAARAGLSPDALAAANGLSPNGVLISGSALRLSGGASMVPVSTSAPASMASSAGAYVVQPGDTLTGIAARAGLSPDSLAAANGLSANGVLVSGTVLRLSGSPGAASAGAATSQPVWTVAEGSPTDPPYPTPERVSAPEVGSIAAANGVPASLADAIAWQESGFNNDLVSSADARGVMQILPGTWQWIQQTLDTGAPLAPASAADNVRGGVLLLHSLLNATGGDPAMAAAGYYQGLPSVQQHGMYSDTQQYVQSVLALERQFGGG